MKLPSDHNSWYNRHKTDIYLMSIAAIIIALSFVTKASLDPPLPTEHLILFLIAMSIAGAVNLYPYVMELIDRHTVSDP